MSSRTACISALLVLAVACEESLQLGSECSDAFAPCHEVPGREAAAADEMESEPEASSSADMDSDGDRGADTERPDAVREPDPDAPPAPSRTGAIEEHVENGALELTRGVAGPVASETSSALGLEANVIAPWSACRPGFSAVQSSYAVRRDADSVEVLPREGAAFVEAAINDDGFLGITQRLKRPLERGGRYAFRVDVRASAGAEVGLEFWSAALHCFPTMRLAETPAVQDSWRSVCVVLEPSWLETQELIVRAVGRPGTRVFFDHLRSDPGCR